LVEIGIAIGIGVENCADTDSDHDPDKNRFTNYTKYPKARASRL